MACLPHKDCVKCCNEDTFVGVQKQSQFVVGRRVGFTDHYKQVYSRNTEHTFNDWIISHVIKDTFSNKGVVEIQRIGLPNTKFIINWQWLYLK